MKAIILAAGESSRFYPYTDEHKSLTKLLGKPIIVYTIESIRNFGVSEIIIVVSPKSAIRNILKEGKDFGVKIKYAVQKNPTGAGDALLLLNPDIGDDFFLLNASHVDFLNFGKLMLAKKKKGVGAVLLAKKERILDRFGVPDVNKDKVLSLVEKPKIGKEPSNLKIIGIYLFSKSFLKVLKETPSEHYSLEKAISALAKKEDVKLVEILDDAVSLKYPWDLLSVKNYLIKSVKRSISSKTKIAKSARILGDVVIEEGAEILEGANIKGPSYIGRNVIIGNNALIRNASDIEEDCVIGAYMEVKNSLVMKGVKTHSGFIGDSVIGENSKIGAQFSTANVRLDRETIKILMGNGKVDTGLNHFGAIIGGNAKVGIKCSTMPGIIIGKNAVIGPSTVVLNNVLPSTKYYTKFKEIVIKK